MLALGNASALGAASGGLTVNGGTLDLNGNSPSVGPLSGLAGIVTSSTTGGVTLSVAPRAARAARSAARCKTAAAR